MKLRCQILAAFTALTLIHSAAHTVAAELRIPAFTAYMLPDPESARISESNGVTQWNDVTQSVNWHGKFKAKGELTARVQLRLPEGSMSKLRLTVDGTSQETTVTGAGSDKTASSGSGITHRRSEVVHSLGGKSGKNCSTQ